MTHAISKLDLGLLTLAIAVVCLSSCTRQEKGQAANLPVMDSSLSALIESSPDTLKQLDIARMNFICAEGLPGAEKLDITNSLAVIDQMAARVRSEAERHLYRFQKKPEEFENSEGFFRMTMMMVVLAEDFRVRYAPNKMATAANASMGDGFFANSQDVFLHGLTGATRQGTCSSLPVLYVAVGRRLGYPLKLVTTKGHLFVRWESASERFNFEAAGNGANRFSDDYYRHWPLEVTEAEVQADGHLKSLTPAEELAVFLSIRGMCQAESGNYAESFASFAHAAKLATGCRSYGRMRDEMAGKLPLRTARNHCWDSLAIRFVT